MSAGNSFIGVRASAELVRNNLPNGARGVRECGGYIAALALRTRRLPNRKEAGVPSPQGLFARLTASVEIGPESACLSRSGPRLARIGPFSRSAGATFPPQNGTVFGSHEPCGVSA
jgi:hypothetical protein